MKLQSQVKYLVLLAAALFVGSCGSSRALPGVNTTSLVYTLPDNGKVVNNKPVGAGWVNLIASLNDWVATKPYWSLNDDVLHGDYNGGERHMYAYTKTSYTNFELNAVVRMSGREANSGVCIRPTETDNVPGYQVDMGPGYWGCLWEERRAEMVQKYPRELADKLVKQMTGTITIL